MLVTRLLSDSNILIIGRYVFYNVVRQTERMMTMYIIKNIHGHIQVYNHNGVFLFSADSEQEAREELEVYEESAA